MDADGSSLPEGCPRQSDFAIGRETIKIVLLLSMFADFAIQSHISVSYLCLPLSTHELLLFELFILLAVLHERSVADSVHALVEPICFS